MYAVDYEVLEDGTFSPSPPQRLFEIDGVSELYSLYLTHDGSAFIVVRSNEDQTEAPRRIPRIVLNWDEEIRRILAPEE
jgi:hypothetical protein